MTDRMKTIPRFIVIACLLFCKTIFAQFNVGGVLLDENNEPIAQATIQLIPSENIAITSTTGEFLFSNIQAGAYTVFVDSEWWQTSEKIMVDQHMTDLILKSNDALPIEEVMIKSIRFGQQASAAQHTLSKNDIVDQLAAADMPYIMQFTPSVVVTSDAGSGVGYTGMRIRGSDQTRINVTINGIPLNDAESQNVFFVDLPDLASSAQSIQIQRGVGTSSQGAASFGASVNVNTHAHDEEASVQISGLLGSFNTQKAALQFNTGKIGDGLYLNGRLSQITSDGYIDRATSDLKSFALSPLYLFGKSSIRYDLLYGKERTYQAWYGTDPATLEVNRTYNPAGTEREGQPYEDQVDDYQQVHHQLHFNTVLNQKIQLGVSAHYTPGNGFYEEYKAGQSRIDYGYAPVMINGAVVDGTDLVRRRWLDNHFYGMVGNLNYTIDQKSDLILGGGWNHYIGKHFGEIIWAEFAQDIQSSDRYYENRADKYDGNIYLKYSRTINDRWSGYVDAQYRTITYDFIGPDQQGQATDQQDELHFFNPKLGLVYRANDRLTVMLQSGIAQKEPNRDDYVDSSPLSRPKSEWLWDTEFGATWRPSPKLSLKPNVYYMKYRDQLALTGEINDVGAATRVNVDHSHRLGFELDAVLNLTNDLQLKGNVSISQNSISSLEQFVDSYDANFNYLKQEVITLKNTTLPFSPGQIGYLGLNYQLIKTDRISTSLYANGKYVGKQFIDLSKDQQNQLQAYQTLDVGFLLDLKHSIGKNLRIKLDINNILSEKYSSNAWSYKYLFDGSITYAQGFYPQALRHVNVGLILDF
jgi:iron complex outermembrane receptor protein